MFGRTTLVVVTFSSIVGCASDDSACERAASHIAACFPDHATAPVCDPSTADEIASLPCDEIASWDGKSDNPFCIWTPWLCTGSGGSTGKKIEVAVDECGPGYLCPYVQSAGCGLVTLHDSTDKQIAKGFTSGGGRLTFEGLAKGKYTVKVHKADNTLARMFVSDYTDETAPSRIGVELTSSSDAPWARFNLTNGAQEEILQCAYEARGNITVNDSSGNALDRRQVEWQWFVELETAGTVTEISRLLYSSDQNLVSFRLIPKGTHTIRYIRMDIPSYEQRINPDYARLRRLYSTNHEVEQSLTVTSARFGATIDVSRSLVDPQ